MQKMNGSPRGLTGILAIGGLVLLVSFLMPSDYRAPLAEQSVCGSLLPDTAPLGLAQKEEARAQAYTYMDCRVRETQTTDVINGVHRRARAREWHHTVSVLIFLVVVSMVAAGLWFSASQFRKGSLESPPQGDSELELSLKGIKLKSGAMGVIILALSFGFFLVYIVKVYPLHEFPTEPAPPEYQLVKKLPLPPESHSAQPSATKTKE